MKTFWIYGRAARAGYQIKLSLFREPPGSRYVLIGQYDAHNRTQVLKAVHTYLQTMCKTRELKCTQCAAGEDRRVARAFSARDLFDQVQ